MEKIKTESILQAEKEKTTKKFGLNKKWLLVGVLVAFLNPIFAGLVLGAAYLSEPGLKREGKIVTVVAVLWGAFIFYLFRKYFFLFFN